MNRWITVPEKLGLLGQNNMVNTLQYRQITINEKPENKSMVKAVFKFKKLFLHSYH